jgi:hypothetical protein
VTDKIIIWLVVGGYLAIRELYRRSPRLRHRSALVDTVAVGLLVIFTYGEAMAPICARSPCGRGSQSISN